MEGRRPHQTLDRSLSQSFAEEKKLLSNKYKTDPAGTVPEETIDDVEEDLPDMLLCLTSGLLPDMLLCLTSGVLPDMLLCLTSGVLPDMLLCLTSGVLPDMLLCLTSGVLQCIWQAK